VQLLLFTVATYFTGDRKVFTLAGSNSNSPDSLSLYKIKDSSTKAVALKRKPMINAVSTTRGSWGALLE
jgi:hypothetical protein